MQDIKNANKLIVNNHYHELLNKVSELDYLDQTLINNYESDLLAALEDGLLAIDASDTVALISQERNNVILVLESLYLNNYRENAKLEILDDANYMKDKETKNETLNVDYTVKYLSRDTLIKKKLVKVKTYDI